MENNRGPSATNGQGPRSTSITSTPSFGNSRLPQDGREFIASNGKPAPVAMYLTELGHVYREGRNTTDEKVARLAAALIARAPAELARLLEVQA
jgi:hypothetical protein